MEDPESCLDPQRFLVPAYCFGVPRFMDGPAEVLAQVYSFGDTRLIPGPAEVSRSCQLQWRFQTHAQTCRGLWLQPTPSVVAPLYLLLWSSLSRAYFGLGRWLSSVSINVSALGPLLWRLWLGLTKVSGSVLLPQGSQTHATGLLIITNILSLANQHQVPQQIKLLFKYFQYFAHHS